MSDEARILRNIVELAEEVGIEPSGVMERLADLDAYPDDEVVEQYNTLRRTAADASVDVYERLRAAEAMDALHDDEPRLPDVSETVATLRQLAALSEEIDAYKAVV